MSDRFYLDGVSREDCQRVRAWRNAEHANGSLRTPYPLSADQQDRFFEDLAPQDRQRYYAVRQTGQPAYTQAAMVGLTNIAWENGTAELSLIVNPDYRRIGVGRAAVALILREAFERLRLAAVVGEVYHCNAAALPFWRQCVAEHHGSMVVLPCRKFWNGQHYDADVFTICAPTEARA